MDDKLERLALQNLRIASDLLSLIENNRPLKAVYWIENVISILESRIKEQK